MFESGAILIYLAEKTGKFLPTEPEARIDVLQWLMFQMGGIGPFFGQTHHFNRFAKEKIPYAIERYVGETKRLYGVMDGQLEKRAYLAGDYSIADIAHLPLGRALGVARSGHRIEGLSQRDPVVRRDSRAPGGAARLQRAAVRSGDTGPLSRPGSPGAHPAVERVRQALRQGGSAAEVIALGETARTAQAAASALEVPQGAIVKSLLFTIDGAPVMALIAGDRRCDTRALPAAFGLSGLVMRPYAERVRQATGFAIGGVAPIGHPARLPTAIDDSLGRFETIYAAAGHPFFVFPTTMLELSLLTGGAVVKTISVEEDGG